MCGRPEGERRRDSPRSIWNQGSMMAHRLALRGFLSLSGRSLTRRVRTSSGLLALSPHIHGVKSTSLPLSRVGGLASSHQISTSSSCQVTFNVQSKCDFEKRVVGSDVPVVVDFHAQWCGPCKILAPRLEKVIAKQKGKVLMAKVDIDDHTDLAIEYEVNAVPTVIAVKNGAVVDQFVGIKDEDQLEAFLNKLTAPSP